MPIFLDPRADFAYANAMAFVLRLVQRYRPQDRAAFMALEARFAAMERRRPDMPQGRRSQPYAGRDPVSTLIWECAFPTLAEAQDALTRLAADPEHEAMFQQQAPYMAEAYTEIYETLEF